MKIIMVETFVLGIPWRSLTYVQVHIDEGQLGAGETREQAA
jgi:hypothetical protein